MTTLEPAAGAAIPVQPRRRPAAFSLSNPLAAAMAERGIYYGWFVAGATFLVMLATAGAMGAPGVIIQPLEKEFGWSTAQISVALAVRLALFGLIAPFAAAFINRFGVRPVVVSAIAMIIAGILASMAMTEVWELVALWGVIVGIGTGMVALVLGATIATRWFVERRGLVVGMLTASSATGQLIFLPLIAKLAQDHGWRSALVFVVAMLLVAGTVALLLLRDRPADVGLAPFGERAIQPAPKQAPGLGAMMASPLRALYAARASRTFWVLFATFYVCGLSTNGLIQTHWVSLCGDYGIAPVAAAGALAMIGAFDFVGTIFSGWLSDRYDNRWLLFMYYGLRGLSLIALPFTDFSVVGLSAFAVFYGLDWVATVPPTVRLTAQRFGAENANLTFGWIFTAHQLGAATAAFGAGFSRSDFATYLPALYVAGVACVLAAGLVLTIGRRPKEVLATA
jgi:predicted MFS family arabinose efflux permease